MLTSTKKRRYGGGVYSQSIVALPGAALLSGPSEYVQKEVSVNEEPVSLTGRQGSTGRIQIKRPCHRS